MDENINIPKQPKGFIYIRDEYLIKYREHQNYYLIKKIYLEHEKALKRQYRRLCGKWSVTLGSTVRLDISRYYYRLNVLMNFMIYFLDLQYQSKIRKKQYENIINKYLRYNLIDLLFHKSMKFLQLVKNFQFGIVPMKKAELKIYVKSYYKSFFDQLVNFDVNKSIEDMRKRTLYSFLHAEPAAYKTRNKNFNDYFLSYLYQLESYQNYKTYFEFVQDVLHYELFKKLKGDLSQYKFNEGVLNEFYYLTEIDWQILAGVDLKFNNKRQIILFETANINYLERKKFDEKFTHAEAVREVFGDEFNDNILVYERKYRNKKKEVLAKRKSKLIKEFIKNVKGE